MPHELTDRHSFWHRPARPTVGVGHLYRVELMWNDFDRYVIDTDRPFGRRGAVYKQGRDSYGLELQHHTRREFAHLEFRAFYATRDCVIFMSELERQKFEARTALLLVVGVLYD